MPLPRTKTDLPSDVVKSFGVLDVRYNCNVSLGAIRKAYLKQALLIHPDKNSSQTADDQFKEVSLAYRTILAYYNESVKHKQLEWADQVWFQEHSECVTLKKLSKLHRSRFEDSCRQMYGEPEDLGPTHGLKFSHNFENLTAYITVFPTNGTVLCQGKAYLIWHAKDLPSIASGVFSERCAIESCDISSCESSDSDSDSDCEYDTASEEDDEICFKLPPSAVESVQLQNLSPTSSEAPHLDAASIAQIVNDHDVIENDYESDKEFYVDVVRVHAKSIVKRAILAANNRINLAVSLPAAVPSSSSVVPQPQPISIMQSVASKVIINPKMNIVTPSSETLSVTQLSLQHAVVMPHSSPTYEKVNAGKEKVAAEMLVKTATLAAVNRLLNNALYHEYVTDISPSLTDNVAMNHVVISEISDENPANVEKGLIDENEDSESEDHEPADVLNNSILDTPLPEVLISPLIAPPDLKLRIDPPAQKTASIVHDKQAKEAVLIHIDESESEKMNKLIDNVGILSQTVHELADRMSQNERVSIEFMTNIAADHRMLTNDLMRNELDKVNQKHKQILAEKEKHIKELKQKNNILSATVNQMKDTERILKDQIKPVISDVELSKINGDLLVKDDRITFLEKEMDVKDKRITKLSNDLFDSKQKLFEISVSSSSISKQSPPSESSDKPSVTSSKPAITSSKSYPKDESENVKENVPPPVKTPKNVQFKRQNAGHKVYTSSLGQKLVANKIAVKSNSNVEVEFKRGGKVDDSFDAVKRDCQKYEFDSVSFLVGGNNMDSVESVESCYQKYEEMISYVHEQNPSANINIIKIPPRSQSNVPDEVILETNIKIKKLNQNLMKLQDYDNVFVHSVFTDIGCDIADDGVHLTKMGTIKLANVIRNNIYKLENIPIPTYPRTYVKWKVGFVSVFRKFDVPEYDKVLRDILQSSYYGCDFLPIRAMSRRKLLWNGAPNATGRVSTYYDGPPQLEDIQ